MEKEGVDIIRKHLFMWFKQVILSIAYKSAKVL